MEFFIFFVLINALPGLAIPFYISRGKAFVGLVDKLIIGIIISPLILIIVSFVEEFARIPQNGFILTANIATLSLINLFILYRFFPERGNYSLRLSWVKIVAYALFIALVIYRVFPTLDFFTPVMHDPVSHSEWLKQLNTTHFTTTEQWYPQGLEYFLNYYVTFLPLTYPKAVLVFTNFFVAVFPISLYYLGLFTFRGRDKYMLYALIMFVFATRLKVFNEFFFSGGKNSTIFAFSISPLLLYLINFIKRRWEYVIFALSIFSVILIHYPTGFFILFTFFVFKLFEIVSFKNNRLKVDRDVLFNCAIFTAVLSVMCMLLAFKIFPIYLNVPVGEDRSLDVVRDYIAINGIKNFLIFDFLAVMSATLQILPFSLFIAAIGVLLFVKDDNKEFPLKIFLAFALYYLIGLPILVLSRNMGVFYYVEARFFVFFTFVISVSWFIHYVIQRVAFRVGHKALISVLTVVVASIFFLQGGWKQYNLYIESQEVLQTVYDEDLEAFEYINTNLGQDDKKVLIQIGDSGNGVVAGADSGVWIPSFTDKQVEVAFREYSLPKAREIYELYLSVAEKQDYESIKELYCRYDIGYVFFGSKKIYSDNMQKEDLENSAYFEDIFSNGTVLYRITDVECT